MGAFGVVAACMRASAGEGCARLDAAPRELLVFASFFSQQVPTGLSCMICCYAVEIMVDFPRFVFVCGMFCGIGIW